jgi:receptor-type tyrosine-protein phosphatase F
MNFVSVPGEPRKVKVEAINSSAISVQWWPPDERALGSSGIIRGYQIYYGSDGGMSSGGALSDDNSGLLSASALTYDVADPAKADAVISGLMPDTGYVVQVAAYTRKGDGRRSRPLKIRTKGAGNYCQVLFLLSHCMARLTNLCCSCLFAF